MDGSSVGKKCLKVLAVVAFIIVWLALTGVCVFTSLNAGNMRIEVNGIILMSFSIVPFLLIGALYGYFISLISFTVSFIVSLIYNTNNAYMMAIYLVSVICFSLFSQYYFFKTGKKTFVAALITLLLT